MGILDDTIQPQARFAEIRRERSEGGSVRAHSATYHGYVDGDGPRSTDKRGQSQGTVITAILKRETMWKNQRTSVHKRSTTAGVHPEGRGSIANRVNRVDVHHRGDSGERREAGTLPRCTERFCEHGRRRKRTDGTERRASGDDGTHRAADVPEAYHSRQEGNTGTVCEAAEGAIRIDESKLAVLPKTAEGTGRLRFRSKPL